jgi:hypothetical protein
MRIFKKTGGRAGKRRKRSGNFIISRLKGFSDRPVRRLPSRGLPKEKKGPPDECGPGERRILTGRGNG